MNRIVLLIVSFFEFMMGGFACLAAAYMLIDGEQMWKWLPAMVISVAYVYLGIGGIRDYFRKR